MGSAQSTGGGTGGAGRTAEPDALDVIELQMAVLARTLEGLRRRSDVYAELDRACYLLLLTLDELGPSSINALARRLGLDASTVTRQVASMEADRLVERSGDPGDRRASIIAPTALGRARTQGVQRRRRERIGALLTDWEPTELSDLARLLTRLNAALTARTAALPPATPDETTPSTADGPGA